MKKLALLIPCLALATAAHGALLLQEDFNSLTVGGLNGQNSWTAVTGVNVTAGGQNYSSGSITINGGTNRVQSNLLSTGVDAPLATHSFTSQSGEVWFSLTLLVNSSVNNSRYWFWVSDTININTGITGALADSNTGSKNIFAEIRNTSTPVSDSGGPLSEDTVHFLVGRLSKDGPATDANAYDRMELWLDPSSTTLGTAAATANGPTNSSFTGGIANFGLTTLSTAAVLQWDNLRIGTTQIDVIPEPATTILLGLGALGLVTFRRRRI